MNAFNVVEFYYDLDTEDTVKVLESFTDEATAQAFAERHYETQLGTRHVGLCQCGECADGWRVHQQNRKAYAVEVWDTNTTTTEGMNQ